MLTKFMLLACLLVALTVTLIACSDSKPVEEPPPAEDVTMITYYALLHGSLSNTPFTLEETKELLRGENFYQSTTNEHIWTVINDQNEWVMMYFSDQGVLLNMDTNIFD